MAERLGGEVDLARARSSSSQSCHGARIVGRSCADLRERGDELARSRSRARPATTHDDEHEDEHDRRVDDDRGQHPRQARDEPTIR